LGGIYSKHVGRVVASEFADWQSGENPSSRGSAMFAVPGGEDVKNALSSEENVV
jgi:hypothetical protein